MKYLVTGTANRLSEIQQKLPDALNVTFFEIQPFDDVEDEKFAMPDPTAFDVVVNLNADDAENFGLFPMFSQFTGVLVVSAVKQSLAEMVATLGFAPQFGLIGFNALPTFINRSKAEISLYSPDDETSAKELFSHMGWEPLVVGDRVGMVTTRIVMMLINEACLTLQEGTATATDIDNSMKLGTNYPLGPLEWADKIGVKDVYETMIALYFDTHDERYKPAPLLKTKFLRGENLLG